MKPVLTHIALHIQDLDACRVFYQEFCQLRVIHERHPHGKTILWMAEAGREQEFVFVLISGGPNHPHDGQDFSHLGFAVDSKAAVDVIADRARLEGCLVWEPVDEPFPVGYYCGLRDPDGNYIEFSYGQPLGPGAPSLDDHFHLASDGIE
ncbi:VOC family protein [Motiliproteus sp. MSK22-1]|uniref:VOC family protein n=1 Tax=Motiliproteus sp. MSK22-1 TaxID=1897630 RepID=UPI000976A130|nr:VOC family protein [Motiliproteus sp. MSK22-1]OMH38054.1 hypothetical protein BGP75_07160 [Motiliproteus sp. MSK22-1]